MYLCIIYVCVIVFVFIYVHIYVLMYIWHSMYILMYICIKYYCVCTYMHDIACKSVKGMGRRKLRHAISAFLTLKRPIVNPR